MCIKPTNLYVIHKIYHIRHNRMKKSINEQIKNKLNACEVSDIKKPPNTHHITKHKGLCLSAV